MAKNNTRRKKDIKSKLIAAICMLLVSTIMMVSSTYAWFTLSTAPEVTGIQTAVGANGNLEMALLPVSGLVSEIGDYTGADDGTDINTTWGNLVDMANGTYGMDKVELYPAKLNAEAAATHLTTDALLSIPTYGADGRVSGFGTAALTGAYGDGAFTTGGYGFRVVGTSSGMTEREEAYTSAKAAANTAAKNANTKAGVALNAAGSALAGMAISRALDDAATFDKDDIKTLWDAFVTLQEEGGPLDQAETAIKQYMLASYLATASDEISIEDTRDAFLNATLSKDMTTLGVYTLPSGVAGMINVLVDAQEKAAAGAEKMETLHEDTTKTSYVWGDFSTEAAYLVNIDTMTIGGHELSYWMEKDGSNYAHLGELIADMQDGGITMDINGTANSTDFEGIYLALADLSGAVSGSVKTDPVEYQGIQMPITGTMKVHPRVSPDYLTTAKGVVPAYSGGDASANSAKPISTHYGYILDLAFRTNAADSYLKLQTEGVDRIYDENTNAETTTMGGGSTMTFDASSVTGYNPASTETLMASVRVVFFDPETGEIFGYARLDSSEVQVADGKYTMPLKMWDNAANGWATTENILALSQNTATKVSVLVYLDGEQITNSDVGNSKLSGTMNLQFSSSADLDPMDYNDLMNGNNPITEPAAGN